LRNSKELEIEGRHTSAIMQETNEDGVICLGTVPKKKCLSVKAIEQKCVALDFYGQSTLHDSLVLSGPHGRRERQCVPCATARQIEHGDEQQKGSICRHLKRRSRCKECGGNEICAHGRVKNSCYRCKRRNQQVTAPSEEPDERSDTTFEDILKVISLGSDRNSVASKS
jgi:hypothetical protein